MEKARLRPRTGSDTLAGVTIGSSTGFDPSPRTGSDAISSDAKSLDGLFQSTPPHGVRRCRAWCWWRDRRFDPRPRTGSDCTLLISLLHNEKEPKPREPSQG